MISKMCFYNFHGKLKNGNLIAIVPHSFENKQPIACGVVESENGAIIVVPITDVRFAIPGNEDKRSW